MYLLVFFRHYVYILLNCVNVWCRVTSATNENAVDWLPSDKFKNKTSFDWFSQDEAVVEFKTPPAKNLFAARNFRISDKVRQQQFTTANVDEDDYDGDEEFTTFGATKRHGGYKAVPFDVESHIVKKSNGNSKTPFYTNHKLNSPYFSSYASLDIMPSTNYKISADSDNGGGVSQGSQFPTSDDEKYNLYSQQQQHPLFGPMYQMSTEEATTSANSSESTTRLYVNGRHALYLQPGKCSNSVEIIRLRDVEVKSVWKQQQQKTICVLMLYSVFENNKLALSVQSSSTTAVATANWLEENIKIYSSHEGKIKPLEIKSNFGVNSPALILTKSSLVLLSIISGENFDFEIDISTYRSSSC